MMRSDRVVAYAYRAELLCEDCVLTAMRPLGWTISKDVVDGLNDTEGALDYLATAGGLDRYNEHSFDSDDFPKVVFADAIEDDDHCGACGEKL